MEELGDTVTEELVDTVTEELGDTGTEIFPVLLIGLRQMLSPVPRGIPQERFDISVNPLRQLWVLGIE